MALFSKGKTAQPKMTPEEMCDVLSDLWLNFREEAQENEAWSNFFDYNDISLPLSYMVAEDLVLGMTEQAATLIKETWVMFCEHISIDPNGFYADIEDAFMASPNPPLAEAESSFSRTKDETQDHGLEGFMGRRAPDHERTVDYVLSQPKDESNINVTQGAWVEMRKFCQAHGTRKAQMRLYFLPCQCGGHQWGIFIDEQRSRDDVVMNYESQSLLMDAVTAKNTKGSRLNSDGRGNGDFTFSFPLELKRCSCGDNWRPTLAVAAAAVAFGAVKRNIAIANGWLEDTNAHNDFVASNGGDYSDSGGSDYDYDVGFDMGGF